MGTVFDCFGCFPRYLERIIAKVLGCSGGARIRGVLGMGSFNLVLDVLLRDTSKGEQRRVAIRIPLTKQPPSLPVQQVISGCAATLFMSELGLPVAVAGPVHLATIPYAPPGQSHLTVMPVLEGSTAWMCWNSVTMEFKKTLVADLAAVVLKLYRHPLQGFGNMALSADGVPCIGPLHDGAVAVAIERGLDVGARGLSPGPYLTWKEFAWNQIQGLLLLYGEHPRYGEQIRADSKCVLEWLDKFEPPDEKLYLVHPDFKPEHVLVDPAGLGHVRSIFDWDFARTGTVQFLAANFFVSFEILPEEVMEEEEWEEEKELLAVYVEELKQGGAPELVQYVVRGWEKKDPQTLFEKALCPIVNLHKHTAKHAYSCLRSFSDSMGFSPEVILPLVQPPWKRRHSSSSSSSSEEEPSSASTSLSSEDEPSTSLSEVPSSEEDETSLSEVASRLFYSSVNPLH